MPRSSIPIIKPLSKCSSRWLPSASGSIYYGYMDVTYFSVYPGSFKDRKLKAAIVFVYEMFRFEVWLAGFNKQAQSKYWKLYKESGWDKYHIVPTTKGVDSILEHILADNPDFSDLDTLTNQIESGTLKFIEDMRVSFLSTKTALAARLLSILPLTSRKT